MSNAEREMLDILQKFEPENEESVTVLESLRDGLTDKLHYFRWQYFSFTWPKRIGRGISRWHYYSGQ